MKFKFLFAFVLFSIATTACREAVEPPAANQVLKPTTNVSSTNTPTTLPSASTNASPTVSTPDKAKIKTYDGKGVVTKINLELVSVELDHEEIKGLMPKMTMEFYVKEKSQLERLKVGETVDFVLEDNAGAEQIVNIKKSN